MFNLPLTKTRKNARPLDTAELLMKSKMVSIGCYVCLLPWTSAGGSKRAFSPLKIGPKNQTFLANMKSAAQFRLIDLILAMTVYLPVRHSHCTRASSRSWCHSELAVHLCPLVCGAKLGSGFFWCWSFLRNNNMLHFKLR